MVYNLTDPGRAIEYWLKTFTDVYNKACPLQNQES